MTDRIGTVVLVEPSFQRYLAHLPEQDRERCLLAILWHAKHRDRNRVIPISGSHRRRLKHIKVNNHLRAICAQVEEEQHWVWAGRFAEMSSVGRKLDAAPIEDAVELDLDAALGRDKEASSPIDAAAPARDEVDKVLEAMVGVAMFAADTRELCAEISKRREILSSGVFAREYNVLKLERDRLAEKLKIANKRIDQLVAKSASDANELKKHENSKDAVSRLTAELAASRAALHKAAHSAVTSEIKEQLKERCAKVADGYANLMASLGRKRDEERIEDIHEVAKRIRALKF